MIKLNQKMKRITIFISENPDNFISTIFLFFIFVFQVIGELISFVIVGLNLLYVSGNLKIQVRVDEAKFHRR